MAPSLGCSIDAMDGVAEDPPAKRAKAPLAPGLSAELEGKIRLSLDEGMPVTASSASIWILTCASDMFTGVWVKTEANFPAGSKESDVALLPANPTGKGEPAISVSSPVILFIEKTESAAELVSRESPAA